MTRRGVAITWVVAVAIAGVAAFVAAAAVRQRWQRAALDTPVQRGRIVAERMGCFGCHGAGGAHPIANPGAKGGEVPGWAGGTWMMWNRDERDVRAWIVDGRPAHREPDAGALIKMPAYGGRLTASEIDELVAYVLAVSHFGAIQEPNAAVGQDAAYRLGCFGCHGPEGRGLVMNPGSFKGYIPAWDGADYAELVESDAELREWILDGACRRLRDNPIARRLLESQAIVMPAYRGRISDEEVGAIAAYIAWVRMNPRTGAVMP